jgi:L-alanine-DL-glutamate epimerase-like enolase superfamily enzyme
LKITAIRLQRIRLPLDPPFHAAWDPVPRKHFDATVVRVETDEGVVGIGSGDTMDGFEPYVALFIGKDPMQVSRHVRVLETINFHAGRYWPLEAALWDIVGKVTGQPVSVLFGGALDSLPTYASCGEVKPAAQRAESALELREMGFRALKIRFVREGLAEGLAAVRAVRKAVGTSMEIMVDMNQAWRMPGDIEPALDPASVRRTVEELRELAVLWVEEPLPGADVEGFARLRAETGVRIAAGEMTRTLPELLDYLDSDALDVYQPDVVLAVGMARARLVAELALFKNRWFTPHTWTNGLGLLANLHVAAGVGGGPYLEFPFDPPGWTVERRDFFLAEPLRIGRDGCLAVPARPGLGVDVDEDKLAHYALKTS